MNNQVIQRFCLPYSHVSAVELYVGHNFVIFEIINFQIFLTECKQGRTGLFELLNVYKYQSNPCIFNHFLSVLIEKPEKDASKI